jgi:hypothetical protein
MSTINFEGYRSSADLKTWEKSYWYLRILIDTNRYGALGKNPQRLNSLQNNLLTTYSKVMGYSEPEETKIKMLDSVFKQTLFDRISEGSKTFDETTALYDRLNDFLKESKDYFILAYTIKELMVPANEAVTNVPSSEVTDFAIKYAKAVLDVKKEKGLATLIREWDSLTEDLALNKERDIIVDLFKRIKHSFKNNISAFHEEISEENLDTVLTAVCQEYERRVGQKRKQRAGKDLEGATEFIFHYFGIRTHGGPEHFTTGMEVDNWIKDRNGWYIGVSLKRTLRERWKQTYTTETGLMDRFKIKNIVHLINNDYDLSDSKIAELGAYRHLFFIADESPILANFQSHVAMGKYLYPMSSLISKINELINS